MSSEPSSAGHVSRETVLGGVGPARQLQRHCTSFGLVLTDADAGALVALLDQMSVQPQNLTSVYAIDEGVRVHLADSLVAVVAKEISGAHTLCDIGSGAGFPGLALARLLPDCRVTLIESEGRKAQWLERASVLSPNVQVVNDRSEHVARQRREEWDVVTARAVAPLPALLELAAPLCRVGGHLVAWRGRLSADEDSRAGRAGAQVGFRLVESRPVKPFEGAQRRLDVWRKDDLCPNKFPRRPGMAVKRPLA